GLAGAHHSPRGGVHPPAGRRDGGGRLMAAQEVAGPGSGARDFWVDADGVRLHGLDWGGAEGGIPVILLHGIGGTAMSFSMLGPRLAEVLGDRFRVVSIDQRGGGDSDKPMTGYEQELFARDVLAVQDAMGGAPAVLVGHSRGGWLAPYAPARRP